MRLLEFSSAVADLVLVSPVLGTKRDLELNEQKNEKRTEEKESIIKVEQRPLGKRRTKSGTKVGKKQDVKKKNKSLLAKTSQKHKKCEAALVSWN